MDLPHKQSKLNFLPVSRPDRPRGGSLIKPKELQ
jgi:hypothetical protein